MIVITEETREKMNEALHDELVEQVKEGDTTVLFEIIEGLNNNTVFYSLSDKAQEKIKLNRVKPNKVK